MPSEDSIQPAHLPSLIKIFIVKFQHANEDDDQTAWMRRLIRVFVQHLSEVKFTYVVAYMVDVHEGILRYTTVVGQAKP